MTGRTDDRGRRERGEELVHPELVGVHVDEDSGGDLSRSEVILKGALLAGAVYGVAMVGPFVRRGLAMAGGGDIDILNFALALEYLESNFYVEGYGRVKGDSEQEFLIGCIADYEPQHVEAVAAAIKQLGGRPVAEPKFDFSYDDAVDFLKLAQTFEDTVVSAYNGIAPSIDDKEVLGLVAAIVQTEARFAAAVRLQNEAPPAPDAFERPLGRSEVMAVVNSFVR